MGDGKDRQREHLRAQIANYERRVGEHGTAIGIMREGGLSPDVILHQESARRQDEGVLAELRAALASLDGREG